MAKKKVVYAKKSKLDADEFDRKHIKVLISVRLDGDVLEGMKAQASDKGLPYQTYINLVLRERIHGSEEDKIRAIVRDELANKAS
ncbi:MAG: BrnA antitoxin family protein [Deltaproteobacteria bacterium]|nr:BrnA antitoxin family protein [Deltaproteobacteria bacterium]